MELITLSIGYIVNTLAKNKEVQGAVDDFVTQSVNWMRSWFGKEDEGEALMNLESNLESEKAKSDLEDSMKDLVKDDAFRIKLERWVKECDKPEPSMKNVLENVELEIEGNVNIGDKGVEGTSYDKKNVIKNSKIKGGGDFNLGDIGS